LDGYFRGFSPSGKAFSDTILGTKYALRPVPRAMILTLSAVESEPPGFTPDGVVLLPPHHYIITVVPVAAPIHAV